MFAGVQGYKSCSLWNAEESSAVKEAGLSLNLNSDDTGKAFPQ